MSAATGARALARLLDGWQETGRGPGYERLAAVLTALVVDGRLPTRSRLPSERELAAELHVSRTTVAAAYGRLRDDGYLASRQGAGSWTALPDRGTPAPHRGVAPGIAEDSGTIDLAVAAPAPDEDVLASVLDAVGSGLAAEFDRTRSLGEHGYYPAGLPALRQAIADRYTARGAPTSAEQILVTLGAQGAIHLLAQVLVEPGDGVLVEQPTYPNAVDTLRRAGARLLPVPVTADGWDLDRLTDTFETGRPRLAYVMPDFHNPTGALLDGPGRELLAATARRAGALLVVDETHAELPLEPFAGPLPPPVASLDRDGRVVSIGSLSKTFWGGLRIGWIRANPPLIDELARARSSLDLGGPVLDQLVATPLVRRADELLPARRDRLAHRCDVLTAALADRLPGWRVRRPAGGLSLWVTLDGPISTELSAAAGRHGLRLAAGPRFGLDGSLERFVRLPFVLAPTELERAVERLAAAHADVTSRRRPLDSRPAVA